MFCVVFPATISSQHERKKLRVHQIKAWSNVCGRESASVVSVTSGAGATYSITCAGPAQDEDGADTTC